MGTVLHARFAEDFLFELAEALFVAAQAELGLDRADLRVERGELLFGGRCRCPPASLAQR
jgi:hypothetical protein